MLPDMKIILALFLLFLSDTANSIHSTAHHPASTLKFIDNLIFSPEVEETDVVVVGGGLTGCTSAFYLDKADVKVTVLEANDYVGGNILSKTGSCTIVLSIYACFCLSFSFDQNTFNRK